MSTIYHDGVAIKPHDYFNPRLLSVIDSRTVEIAVEQLDPGNFEEITMSVLKMAAGNPIRGIQVSETKFQGITTLNQLEAYGLWRPTRLEKAKSNEMKADRRLREAHLLHAEIQRRFDVKRTRNAAVYARYIQQVECGGRGGATPPITLWVQTALGSENELYLPYGAVIIAIDGETQTEARYLMRDDPDFNLPETGDNLVAVTVFHDLKEGVARQILYDFNIYTNPVSSRQLAAQNSEGPATHAAMEVMQEAGIDLDTVNRYGVTPSKKQSIAQNQVLFAVMGYAMKETALIKNGGSFIDALNNATTSNPINGDTVTRLAPMIKMAIESLDARKSPLPVWQVAGVLIEQGRDPASLNWSAGKAAAKGKRDTKGRLRHIAESM